MCNFEQVVLGHEIPAVMPQKCTSAEVPRIKDQTDLPYPVGRFLDGCSAIHVATECGTAA